MSSAALHTPHQPPTLSSPPLSSSNRPYASSHSSPAVDANNAHAASTSSPSSRRPPSRRTSGNAQSPAVDHNGLPNTRSGMPHHVQQSPQTDRGHNMPPIAPPRTSSTQQPSGSRRAYHQNERASNSPRQTQQEPSRSGTRVDSHGSAENGHRSKRAANSHFAQDLTGHPNENRDNRGTTTVIPVRTHQSASTKPSREANEPRERSTPKSQEAHSRDPRIENNAPQQYDDGAELPPVAGISPPNEDRRSGRSRQDYGTRNQRGTAKFGDFILGNTIGEGEFGKVKLGWRQDSNAQVAIKLIKRDTVGSNPSRLAKIKREVTILRELQHPNIVQLIDMVETDRYIGIILEYASGGELFDHILNHRYLKDQSARRLFAQLVSGVGYLHKKGIVHRDLKLENLLLDRNRNIIITDFGFANTFDPHEELDDEEEHNLSDRAYVKKTGLDKVKPNGTRKGDLMQTSCGSPCYAAPELVVSDCLYTGRKVDVWSCGVILYAMLAGYLPFDDDPANPEGDNINLLYKYIVTTPLTFPEYVTPHARDLLRRILVPNPRKRADLFEVARHSWLSEYAHVVEFITSSTTLPQDVQDSTPNPQEEYSESSLVTRSNSVREGQKSKTHSPTAVGGLAKTHGTIDTETNSSQRTPKETKRRTVQVEYVAPTTQTQRGEEAAAARPRNRSASRGRGDQHASPKDKPLPRDPPQSREAAAAAAAAATARPSSSRRPPTAPSNTTPRGPRDYRTAPDPAFIPPTGSGVRPQTGGSISSAASMGLQSKGHYGLPVPPAVADTNAEGRIQQPQSNDEHEYVGRPSTSVPSQFAKVSGGNEGQHSGPVKGHKRSSTIGEIGSRLLGRSGSVFGRHRKRPEQQQQQTAEKSRKYPPVSMANTTMPTGEEPGSRPSMDSKISRRSFSLGLGKKRSGSITGSQGSVEKPDRRRFSLLPPSFSFKSGGMGKDGAGGTPPPETDSRPTLPIQDPRSDSPRGITSHGDARGSSPIFDPVYNNRPQQPPASNPYRHQRFASAQLDNRRPNAIPPYMQAGTHFNAASDSSVDMRRPPTEPQMTAYQQPYSESDGHLGHRAGSAPRGNRGMLQKNTNKRFTDAYDQEDYRGHEGSSGAAKRVMDFFRRRGKARGGDER